MLIFILILLKITYISIFASNIHFHEYVNNTIYNTDTQCISSINPISPMENTIMLANEYGIDVILEDSEEAVNENVLGEYRINSHNIILYNTPEPKYFDERIKNTLKHELIHAIQHCKGNREKFIHLMDTKSFVICVYKKKLNIDFIEKIYSKEDFLIELEAYCLEDIIKYKDLDYLIKAFCRVL